MQHSSYLISIVVVALTFHKSILSWTLQIISQDVILILWFDTVVQVLRDVYILFCYCPLPTPLIACDLDFIGTKNLTKSCWVIVEKWFAEVVEVLRCEFKEHLKLTLLDFLKYIFVIEWFVELWFSFTSWNICPILRANQRLQKVMMTTTIEPSQGFKLFGEQYLNLEVCSFDF